MDSLKTSPSLMGAALGTPALPRDITAAPARPPEARFYTPEHRMLAVVELLPQFPSQTLVVRQVIDGLADLLYYYFQEGGREVEALLGRSTVQGRLETRWAGSRRQWLVRLSPSREAFGFGHG